MTTALPKTVSSADLATLLGITKRSINALAERGVLPRQADGQFALAESLRAYVTHREDVVAAEDATSDYGKARAELYQEKAEMARMQREKIQGKLLDADEVFKTWASLVTVMKQRLLNIPTKLAPRLLGKRHAAEIETLIRAEIYEALEALANMEVRHRKTEEDEDGPENI
jgi:phage terminase Nu1 subunit (DNA packaging protein)